MALLEDEKAAASAPAANAEETKELFADDPNAESPFVIPSREVGHPFPQGVGGKQVDDFIEARLDKVREAQREQSEVYSQQATSQPGQESPQPTPPAASSRWQSRLIPRFSRPSRYLS